MQTATWARRLAEPSVTPGGGAAAAGRIGSLASGRDEKTLSSPSSLSSPPTALSSHAAVCSQSLRPSRPATNPLSSQNSQHRRGPAPGFGFVRRRLRILREVAFGNFRHYHDAIPKLLHFQNMSQRESDRSCNFIPSSFLSFDASIMP
ncbi:hypothetical protein GUJ93_ZPchr0002g25977 [Zizania palustris]|uniref:Uncharacterized protein n=1 Tax=Zizania palustris TaxID=103762 RepID=A0A8J5VGU9_ZIZPA|nr:hypothetical protein GUJ93_ZPchr0002g25977 [Zizania palustris]